MGMSREALEAVRGEVALLCYCHRPGGGEDNNNDARGEEQDVLLTMRMRCPMTGGRQRRERVTLMVAAMTNTSTDVSGVHVGQIPKMGDGRVHGAIVTMRTRTRRVDCIPPCGGQQHASWRQGCVLPAADRGGRGQRQR